MPETECIRPFGSDRDQSNHWESLLGKESAVYSQRALNPESLQVHREAPSLELSEISQDYSISRLRILRLLIELTPRPTRIVLE